MVAAKRADFKQIGEKFHIDQVTARLIRNRDVIGDEAIDSYLNGDISYLANPFLLKDADLLTDILIQKIKEKKKIRVIGDYDIDGVMSTYILLTALKKVGANADYMIPDRIKDGYGLNIDLVQKANADKVDTILTCDNGIAAIKEINYAKEHGMTVLVTDHHSIPFEEVNGERVYQRSNADAIVNPHQVECKYPYKEFCGGVVVWRVVEILYEKMGIDKSCSLELLEFAAFATVGDVMPLTGENRIIVKEGLKRIRQTTNIGLLALIRNSGLEPSQIEAYHFGFVLGPCVNATGRLDTAKRAVELLICKDPDKAQQMAIELVHLNEERKKMTDEGVKQAIEIYEKNGYEKDAVLVIYLEDMHESIAGIIAGRIREKYHKPTFILTKAEGGVKGSGRSIEEYSMYEEMCKCKDLLDKFGGHPLAAGLSLQPENVDKFRQMMNEKSTLSEDDLEEKVHIDVPMPVSYVTKNLIREFEILAPFGKDNERPVFADKNLSVKELKTVGKDNATLKLTLMTEEGILVDAIRFRDAGDVVDYLTEKFGESEVYAAMNGLKNNIKISIVYAASINVFKGNESVQIRIDKYI